jgi:hypothetical protein
MLLDSSGVGGQQEPAQEKGAKTAARPRLLFELSDAAECAGMPWNKKAPQLPRLQGLLRKGDSTLRAAYISPKREACQSWVLPLTGLITREHIDQHPIYYPGYTCSDAPHPCHEYPCFHLAGQTRARTRQRSKTRGVSIGSESRALPLARLSAKGALPTACLAWRNAHITGIDRS